MKPTAFVFIAACLVTAAASAQTRTEDEHVRYELQSADAGTFNAIYELTVVTAGARTYVQPLSGGTATAVTATDLMTGAPLQTRQTAGRIEVTLARAVPDGGGERIRISLVARDSAAYRRDGGQVVFHRTLEARRAAVALPSDMAILTADLPVQVIEVGEHLEASYMNLTTVPAALTLTARPVKATAFAPYVGPAANVPAAPPDAAPRAQPMDRMRVTERTYQDRTIVYFLKDPQTHAFSLYHDYTASQEGEHQYVNVVRTGSKVSDPSAIVLDTGQKLTERVLTGADIAREHIDIPEKVDPDTEVVLIPFTPVERGKSVRLRISETYSDPARYDVIDGQLMWHRSFGRPRNDMVLPAGWFLTTTSIPAVITQEPDGRTRVSYWNPRPDNVDVFLKARHQ